MFSENCTFILKILQSGKSLVGKIPETWAIIVQLPSFAVRDLNEKKIHQERPPLFKNSLSYRLNSAQKVVLLVKNCNTSNLGLVLDQQKWPKITTDELVY